MSHHQPESERTQIIKYGTRALVSVVKALILALTVFLIELIVHLLLHGLDWITQAKFSPHVYIIVDICGIASYGFTIVMLALKHFAEVCAELVHDVKESVAIAIGVKDNEADTTQQPSDGTAQLSAVNHVHNYEGRVGEQFENPVVPRVELVVGRTLEVASDGGTHE